MKKTISVAIAPARKIAKITQGKKVLKIYNFKTEIPFVIEQRKSYSYDYGEWSVSERNSFLMVNHKVFCNQTINELKVKILKYYLKMKDLIEVQVFKEKNSTQKHLCIIRKSDISEVKPYINNVAQGEFIELTCLNGDKYYINELYHSFSARLLNEA